MFQGRFVWLALLVTIGSSLLSIPARAGGAEAVPGEFIVKLKSTMQVQGLDKKVLSRRLGSTVKGTIPRYNLVVVKRPVFETQTSAVKTLAQNPLVQYAEPNFIYRAVKAPNDPAYGKLWGMRNTGQKDSEDKDGVAGVDIAAEKAWDIETGSDKVLVAVIDTGIDYTHPDLVDNVWTNEAEAKGETGVDDDGNGYVDDIHGMNFVEAETPTGDPLDDHGHGSHVSGTIGGRGDDGKGIVGVNWNVKIMGIKFLSADGGGTLEGAVKAIEYANKMGAKVLSNSWGGGGFSEALKEVIDESNKLGAVFVAAAGNESNNNDSSPSYPASYETENVIAVAAVDNRGNLASFSNYGKKTVHLGAPGVNVYSSVNNATYDSWSGTSMATPHVSGVAALLWAHEPQLTGKEIKQRLVSTTRSLTSLKGKTKSGGMLNAFNALTNAATPLDPDDPENWASRSISLASAHPYKEKISETYELQVPGAKEFVIYFSRFETERNYDVVNFYDKNGKLVGAMSGTLNDSTSMVIPGNYVKLVFQSDDSVQGFGFEATKVFYR
jgi:thermitase